MNQVTTTAGITVAAVMFAGAYWNDAEHIHEISQPASFAWVSGPSDSLLSGYPAGVMSSSGVPDSAGARAVEKSVRDRVALLKEESGLTADQLGRALGVTRRSIHNWVSGSPIADKHVPRIVDLYEITFGLPAETADERRALLLESTAGASLYRQFADGVSSSARMQYPVPTSERLA